MNIIDSLKDIVKHTYGLGFVDIVKVNGTSTECLIEAAANDHSVVIYGSFSDPIHGIDSTVGFSRLQILKGYLENPTYTSKETLIEVVKEKRNNVDIPTEIKFDNNQGSVSIYRLMSAMMVEDKTNIPQLEIDIWDIEFVPEKKKIAELSYNNSVLGSFEKNVSIYTDKNKLKFSIGSGPSDKAEMVFCQNINKKLIKSMQFPIDKLLRVLKLSESANSTKIYISAEGVLKIEIDSGLGLYSYIILAIDE